MTRKEIDKLDKIWSEKVKEIAGYRCEITGRGKESCQLNSHHYIGRTNRAMRWWLPNGVCLSAAKHKLDTKSAHEDPEWFRKEMLRLRGAKWLKDITKRSNLFFKGTYQQVLDYLNGEVKDYL